MEAWEKTLNELKEQYVRGSGKRLDRIIRTLDLLQLNPQDPATLQELQRYFHGLSGSGSTYGFPKISALGLEGEQYVESLLRSKSAPQDSDLNKWKSLLEAIRIEFGKTAAKPAAVPEELIKASVKPHEILVVDDDGDIRQAVTRVFEREGFTVRSVRTKAEAINVVQERVPEGIIVDIQLPDGSGYELVEHVRNLASGDSSAILIISAFSGFLDRVEAIRCGSDGYFEKPIDWDALMRRLQHLLERVKTEAPRILSVEDDADQASFISSVLESAGYQVHVCCEPQHFESELIAFHPDLVLMDVLLPSVSGYELVRYLRQDERNATLPVLFLTTQSQLSGRIEAVKSGGDDYLVKPVHPGLLLSTVAARMERSRFLKSLVERDGLTRLLTHSAFLERAKVLVSKKKRNPHGSYALCMIDLDHFKKVNDTHGHVMGDRVLASLAALMRRRLRQSDVIGRYGGEEFAIIVEDLEEEEAVRLISRLREEFSSIPQRALDGSVFHVTFSAGIAILDPDKMDLERWKQTADDALYAAKQAGRGRVIAAITTPAS
jgi:diguanylate cyclase (GGDEF)-like protein